MIFKFLSLIQLFLRNCSGSQLSQDGMKSGWDLKSQSAPHFLLSPALRVLASFAYFLLLSNPDSSQRSIRFLFGNFWASDYCRQPLGINKPEVAQRYSIDSRAQKYGSRKLHIFGIWRSELMPRWPSSKVIIIRIVRQFIVVLLILALR